MALAVELVESQVSGVRRVQVPRCVLPSSCLATLAPSLQFVLCMLLFTHLDEIWRISFPLLSQHLLCFPVSFLRVELCAWCLLLSSTLLLALCCTFQVNYTHRGFN
jgi:hypothetical protein